MLGVEIRAIIKIPVVDDEESIRDSIDINLTAAGYHYRAIQDGMPALKMIEGESFDLILLGVVLPGMDGYDIMKYIRPLKVPVIFIAVKHEVRDRAKDLRLGADDYLVKPFDMVKLAARVEAVSRRYNKTEHLLGARDVIADVKVRMVTRTGKSMVLTNKGLEFLLLFIRSKNVVLFRETLYEKVWEGEYSEDSRTLGLHVQGLRERPGWENSLVAVYKVGCRFEVPQ